MTRKTGEWLIKEYKERVATLEQKIADLERMDDYNRKAIKTLLKTLEEKRETERSRRVKAEREACAKLLEDQAAYLKEKAEGLTVGEIRLMNLVMKVLRDGAEMIRARSSETSSTVEG
jgi:hypothetical protein